MTRTTPELVSPSSSFRTAPVERRLTTSDVTYTRPTKTMDLLWNWVWSLKPEALRLPPLKPRIFGRLRHELDSLNQVVIYPTPAVTFPHGNGLLWDRIIGPLLRLSPKLSQILTSPQTEPTALAYRKIYKGRIGQAMSLANVWD
ncbi:hypothetical protein AVEN_26567-1 [Araneus ventricosus]|uniref:Uncharacterized protein n=1 Tax=Araneus ventricosus TaxID=182803 RepID=A0A4Y2FQB5_ARAVE|nr:hypothetical protein AVEN_26567-1 [Araneus ventricosus]